MYDHLPQTFMRCVLVDEIDACLAHHYGFTDGKLDYIVNYDIKSQMGSDNNEEGE